MEPPPAKVAVSEPSSSAGNVSAPQLAGSVTDAVSPPPVQTAEDAAGGLARTTRTPFPVTPTPSADVYVPSASALPA